MNRFILIVLALSLLAPKTAHSVTLPYTFSSGSQIKSAEVNANDQALRDGINNHIAQHNGHNTSLEDILAVNPSCGSTNIDFNLTQGVEFRVENLAADPACGASSKGRLIWNTADALFKICNGASYVSIAGTGVNTLASVLTAGNTASDDIDLNGHQLLNAKVESLAADPAAGAAGRLFFNTTSSTLKLDTGSAITAIGGAQGLSSVLSVSNSAGGTNIDFNLNQGLNMLLEKLAANPAGTTARVYYNTVSNVPKFYNGTSWLEIGNTNTLAQTLALGNSAGSNDINLNGHELKSAKVENLAAPPSTGQTGRVWFDTITEQLGFGTSGANRVVTTNDQTQTLTNKTISGASNTITNIPDSALSSNIGKNDAAQTISGAKTFSAAPTIARIKPAAGSTNGHLVPNGADDEFILANAVQTISGKVWSAPSLSGNFDFNFGQAIEMLTENVSATPAAGHPGRVVFKSTTGELLYEDGTNWYVLGVNTTPTIGMVLARGNLAGTDLDMGGNDILNAVIASSSVTGTASRAAEFGAGGTLQASSVTSTELGYVSGVTSGIQAQIDGKQPTGNYITDLTGDVTASGPGSVAATIAANAVTSAKILDGEIVNADVNGSAAIARSKLASGTAGHVVINDGATGAFSSEATLAKSRGGAGADMSSVTFPSSGTIVTETATESLTNKSLQDSTTAIYDSAAPLSIAKVDVTGGVATTTISIGGGGTISLTGPGTGNTATMVTSAGSQLLKNKQLEAETTSIQQSSSAAELIFDLSTAIDNSFGDHAIEKYIHTATQTYTHPDATGTYTLNDNVATLTNKTLTGAVVSNYVEMTDAAAPASPAAGKHRIYVSSSDGKAHIKDSAGTDVQLGSGGSAGAANLITLNPDAEAGTSGWTNTGSGTFTTTTTSANVDAGAKSFSWDAAAANDTIRSDAYSIPAGLYGANCLGRIKYQGGDTNLTLQVLDGSNNVLGSQALSAHTNYTAETVMFPCPTSGSVKLGFSASANAAIVYFDTAFLGENYLLGTVSQATIVGSANTAATASCLWSTTSNAFGDYSADTDCPAPTLTGNATAPATKKPGFVFPSLPSGEYEIVAYGNFAKTSNASYTCYYRFNSSAFTTDAEAVASGSATVVYAPVIVGRFSLSSAQSNVDIEIQAKSDGVDSCSIDASTTAGLTLQLKRFPSSSEQSLRFDQTAQSWSGYHGTDCTWTTTSGSAADFTADGSCTFTELTNKNMGTVSSTGAKTPGITWTPNISGTCRVEVDTDLGSTSAGANRNTLYLTDGSNNIKDQRSATTSAAGEYAPVHLSGDFTVTAGTAYTVKIRGETSAGTTGGIDTQGSSLTKWSVKCLDQSLNAPLIVNSVTSNSSGLERVERVSTGVCSSSPCTISSQSGSWVSSITRASAGDYTVNFTAGIFSSAPTCVVAGGGGTNLFACQIGTSPTTSSVRFVCANSSSTAADSVLQVICMGPR